LSTKLTVMKYNVDQKDMCSVLKLENIVHRMHSSRTASISILHWAEDFRGGYVDNAKPSGL